MHGFELCIFFVLKEGISKGVNGTFFCVERRNRNRGFFRFFLTTGLMCTILYILI